jgi:ParB/RepB/Spo0J family partition protein
MIDISKLVVEIWDCDDIRLPLSGELTRTPPDMAFIQSMIDPGQLEPILVCLDAANYFLAFGRRRLLAARYIKANNLGTGEILVRVVEADQNNVMLFGLIENAQRNANGISDYVAIKTILERDKTATYKSIAKAICKTEAYVKTIDKKYARVPDWALEATLQGKIAETTAILVGSFRPAEQKQCRNMLKEKDKLSHEEAQSIRRFVQKEAVASIMPSLGLTPATPTKQAFFPRNNIEKIAELLEAKKYPELRKFVVQLLSQ